MSIGLTLPFARSTGSLGFLQATDDEFEAVRHNLRSLLVTNWGERVMHSSFGCNFSEFLFEQKTDSLREKIADRVISQLAAWMPFVALDVLNVVFTSDDPTVPENGFAVRMWFRLSGRPELTSVFEQTFG